MKLKNTLGPVINKLTPDHPFPIYITFFTAPNMRCVCVGKTLVHRFLDAGLMLMQKHYPWIVSNMMEEFVAARQQYTISSHRDESLDRVARGWIEHVHGHEDDMTSASRGWSRLFTLAAKCNLPTPIGVRRGELSILTVSTSGRSPHSIHYPNDQHRVDAERSIREKMLFTGEGVFLINSPIFRERGSAVQLPKEYEWRASKHQNSQERHYYA